MKQASIVLFLGKALQGAANVDQELSKQIVVSKILVLQWEEQYGFTLYQVLIIVWPV